MTKSPDRPKPYIVSSDTSFLMQRWAKRSGFEIPNQDYFTSLNKDLHNVLSGYFPGEVIIVGEQTLQTGMNKLASESKLPLISLDRAYATPKTPNLVGFIDATRMVNEQFEDIGLSPRPGFKSLEEQIDDLKTPTESPVALVDDVVFTGGGVKKIAEALAQVNRPVHKVIAGIGIKKGVILLNESGLEVECVEEYAEVIDETCKRDFLACVPMSGRTVRGDNGSYWSAPYFKPFGNPEKWASIPPDKVNDFSDFCMTASIAMWKEVERVSGVSVPVESISRRLKGMQVNISVTEALRRLKI
jgi:hypothetical protein